jgi:hypothetical protein
MGNFVFDPHYGSGGSCICSSGTGGNGYTGCASATTILSDVVVNP